MSTNLANFDTFRRRFLLALGTIVGLAISVIPALGEGTPSEPARADEARVSVTFSAPDQGSPLEGISATVTESMQGSESTPTQTTTMADPLFSSETMVGALGEGFPSVIEVVQPQPPAIEVPKRFQGLFVNDTESSQTGTKLGIRPDQTVYNVPIVVNPRVEGHMRFFHTSIRDRFEQWLVRLGRYKHHVERIFAQFNLPSDLIFLSLVESGFNPHAYSRARATGPWQFMRGTAKNYGLRIDQYVDERRDPIKSTIAAAQYLRDLYDMFGTWPLAMAAYNAGEGKVMRALQRTQSTSYWQIAQTKHLKRETKDYVPRFMAATIIARNPDRYGFPEIVPVPHEFEEVVVDRSVHLRDVAATTGLPYADLDHLNPELRRGVTPPGENYHLKIPVGSRALVESSLDRVKTWKGPLPSAKGEKDLGKWYRVRGGDTVQVIAKRFRLSVSELKARNHITGQSNLTPGQRLRIGP